MVYIYKVVVFGGGRWVPLPCQRCMLFKVPPQIFYTFSKLLPLRSVRITFRVPKYYVNFIFNSYAYQTYLWFEV